MPPDPSTLLAPLALDSRFCARLRAPLALPSQNPSLKLGRLKKCKLAEVNSDTPVFVDALGDQGRAANTVFSDSEDNVNIFRVSSLTGGSPAVSSGPPRPPARQTPTLLPRNVSVLVFSCSDHGSYHGCLATLNFKNRTHFLSKLLITGPSLHGSPGSIASHRTGGSQTVLAPLRTTVLTRQLMGCSGLAVPLITATHLTSPGDTPDPTCRSTCPEHKGGNATIVPSTEPDLDPPIRPWPHRGRTKPGSAGGLLPVTG
ncbi:hypothetical protein Bbelb_177070 [Branchiostoma belcheri]|nr:hypothetical protein Bbelb_177070 [Branchiostoma belcheri]